MKFKTLKTKSIASIALILFMIVPMFFAAVSIVHASNPGTVSIVYSGTTGQTNIAGQGVGSLFNVDIRADNIPATTNGINGYTYKVTWDPTVLALNQVNDPAAFFGTSSEHSKVTTVDLNTT